MESMFGVNLKDIYALQLTENGLTTLRNLKAIMERFEGNEEYVKIEDGVSKGKWWVKSMKGIVFDTLEAAKTNVFIRKCNMTMIRFKDIP